MKQITNNVCKYSDDCFNCPEPDCVLPVRHCVNANVLPYDQTIRLQEEAERKKGEENG